jgi:hypothetical protein
LAARGLYWPMHAQQRWQGLRGSGEGALIGPRAIQACDEVRVVTANALGLLVTCEVARKFVNARAMAALRCAATPTRWMSSVAPEALFFLRWLRCVSLSEA